MAAVSSNKFYQSDIMDKEFPTSHDPQVTIEGDEEVVSTFKRVEELEHFGINKNDISKLKAGGFHTIEAVAHATVKYVTIVVTPICHTTYYHNSNIVGN
jgi:hypothetical protein